jgi:hypothetical protein
VFRAFDTNGDGSIDKGEFQAVLKTLGVEISEASFDEAFVALDLDKNGTITLGEFKQVRFASLLLSCIVLPGVFVTLVPLASRVSLPLSSLGA